MKNTIIGTAIRNDIANEIVIAAFERTGIFEKLAFKVNYIIKVYNADDYNDMFGKYVKFELIGNTTFSLKLI